jgi:hypothetical protein
MIQGLSRTFVLAYYWQGRYRMITRLTAQLFFRAVFAVFLAACGTNAPTLPATSVLAFQTPIVLPTSVSFPQFPLDQLRMVYTVNGSLYLKDGGNLPFLLTDTGNDHPSPIFSEDGEKIVYYRGAWGRFSINADGSEEMSLGIQSGRHTFIPGTHQLLLNETYPCQVKQGGEGDVCSTSFFLVNTDTREIKEILGSAFADGFYPRENFKMSPDGKLISVARSGRIDIFNISGDILYPTIAAYTISSPEELVPIQHWTSDSRALILILPADPRAGSAFPNPIYSVWQYILGGQAVRIPFDNTQPLFSTYGCFENTFVSPDGEWMLYFREPSLYIGNLRGRSTQLYSEGCTWVVFWSPDSKHFIYRIGLTEYFLGSVDKSPIPVGLGEFIAWMDADHYVYRNNADGETKILVGEIIGETIENYETGISVPNNATDFAFVFPGRGIK